MNASPFIFLTRLGLLDILNEPGVTVMVPTAVISELGDHGVDDAASVAAQSTPWIHVIPTPSIPGFFVPWKLGMGESAVLACALAEIESNRSNPTEIDVVIDDSKARRLGEYLGIRVQGTLACLIIGKISGRIVAVRPLLEKLRASGMYLSDDLIKIVLEKSGE